MSPERRRVTNRAARAGEATNSAGERRAREGGSVGRRPNRLCETSSLASASSVIIAEMLSNSDVRPKSPAPENRPGPASSATRYRQKRSVCSNNGEIWRYQNRHQAATSRLNSVNRAGEGDVTSQKAVGTILSGVRPWLAANQCGPGGSKSKPHLIASPAPTLSAAEACHVSACGTCGLRRKIPCRASRGASGDVG